jgi:uncharacterized membrane protein YfcA
VTFTSAVLLAGASGVAGVVNAVAGGGTLLTFPALLAAGIAPVAANATNTVALVPGQLASAYAYRSYLADERRRAMVLAVPSLVGGTVGAALLLLLPAQTFEAIVPWLILFACVLLAAQGPIKAAVARWPHANHPAALWIAQLFISVYGGYFGAGIGILMLAAMAILIPSSLQHSNALKVLYALLINFMAAAIFVASGAARMPEATLMAAASIVGGFLGAKLAQRLPPLGMRLFAIGIGVYAAVRFLIR